MDVLDLPPNSEHNFCLLKDQALLRKLSAPRCQRAPHPADVLWENLHISYRQRRRWDPRSKEKWVPLGVAMTEDKNSGTGSFQIILPFFLDSLPQQVPPRCWCLACSESVVRLVWSSRLVRFACGSLLLLIFMLVLVTPVSVSSELNTIIPDAVQILVARWSLVVRLNRDYHDLFAEPSFFKVCFKNCAPLLIISPED